MLNDHALPETHESGNSRIIHPTSKPKAARPAFPCLHLTHVFTDLLAEQLAEWHGQRGYRRIDIRCCDIGKHGGRTSSSMKAVRSAHMEFRG